MMYLAEKEGRFYPKDLRRRYEVNQWVTWQMADQGPILGECGHFRRLGDTRGDSARRSHTIMNGMSGYDDGRHGFWSIYFRTPRGVLFEVATNEPGFDSDEDTAHLGEALKLPKQHAQLREKLEQFLEPIAD